MGGWAFKNENALQIRKFVQHPLLPSVFFLFKIFETADGIEIITNAAYSNASFYQILF